MGVLFTETVNTGEGADLGGRHQDFRFGHIKFEMIMRHPSGNVMSVQFSSVIQLCLTLCDPMDCRTPGFPVHHQLPEPTQTHVHCISDAIQPSHPQSSPFSSCLQSFPASGFFSSKSVLCIRWPKYWSFSFSISPSNEYSGLISFRMDWLDLLVV